MDSVELQRFMISSAVNANNMNLLKEMYFLFSKKVVRPAPIQKTKPQVDSDDEIKKNDYRLHEIETTLDDRQSPHLMVSRLDDIRQSMKTSTFRKLVKNLSPGDQRTIQDVLH